LLSISYPITEFTPTLLPAFAEAASRRQASRGKEFKLIPLINPPLPWWEREGVRGEKVVFIARG